MKPFPSYIFILFMGLSLLIISCDISSSEGMCLWGPCDEEYLRKLRISEVKVEPNPVFAGQEVAFTCILDGHYDEVRYAWLVEPYDTLLTGWPPHITELNTFSVIAPDSIGVYRGGVRVTKPGYDFDNAWFEYEVKNRPKISF